MNNRKNEVLRAQRAMRLAPNILRIKRALRDGNPYVTRLLLARGLVYSGSAIHRAEHKKEKG